MLSLACPVFSDSDWVPALKSERFPINTWTLGLSYKGRKCGSPGLTFPLAASVLCLVHSRCPAAVDGTNGPNGGLPLEADRTDFQCQPCPFLAAGPGKITFLSTQPPCPPLENGLKSYLKVLL